MNTKKWITVLLPLFLLIGLVGCGNQQAPSPAPPAEPTTETTPKTEESSDTYWIAYQWHSSDGEGAEGPFPMKSDTWMVDLLLCADGTACLRDIHDGLYLMDDADLHLTWTQDEDGTLQFSNDIYQNTVYHATQEEDELLFDYRGTILTMRQEALPKDAGEQFHPAELVGTWLMATEKPNDKVESLIFKTVSTAEAVTLAADYECRDLTGTLDTAFYGQALTLLDQPLHEDCSNQTWSIRIVADDTGIYVTLIDRNILLMRHADAAADHCLTFHRMPERLTWWDVQTEELAETAWIGPDDLYLYLNIDSSFSIGHTGSNDEIVIDTYGTWTLTNGGVLLLQGEDVRYIGAVSGYCYETEYGFIESYDMALYDGTEIFRLSFQGYG